MYDDTKLKYDQLRHRSHRPHHNHHRHLDKDHDILDFDAEAILNSTLKEMALSTATTTTTSNKDDLINVAVSESEVEEQQNRAPLYSDDLPDPAVERPSLDNDDRHSTSSNYSRQEGENVQDEEEDAVERDLRYFSETALKQQQHEVKEDTHGHEYEGRNEEQEAEEVVVVEEDEEEEEELLETQLLPSATADAMETYVNITENIYVGSATGKSIAEESMPCECKYRPDIDKNNPDAACGDDNHCINRMMFMECMVDDCPCDRYCRNRRFQLKQYARVDVIRTEKKGFGLRALTDLPANAFIMEYIGEVITNSEFIKRTKEYEADGLKHYYFMTLKTDEIIDATKKGCLARFINHSCNPNCVTQKWVVGKNMRIGIFTRRPIKAGSELTFDYKFERYGAVAQKCYCEEPNCKGYIGGSLKSLDLNTLTVPSAAACTAEKVGTLSSKSKRKRRLRRRASLLQGGDENGTSETNDQFLEQDDLYQSSSSYDDDEDGDLSSSTSSGSSMDEDDDDADASDSNEDLISNNNRAVTLTQKKMLRSMRKRRSSEKPLQDVDKVQSFVKRMLDSVGKSHLVLKLLLRLELTEKKDVLKTFVRLHGLKMLKFWLGEWKKNDDILMKVLQVLAKLPLANRNGLEDANMFELVEKITQPELQPNEQIRQVAEELLKSWSQLKSVYRIPKRISTLDSKDGSLNAKDPQLEMEGDGMEDIIDTDSSSAGHQPRLHFVPASERYDSSRAFFDPDDDIFEHLSFYVDVHELQWKTEFPPKSVIPTAPRAMIDACLRNGYYGYVNRSSHYSYSHHYHSRHTSSPSTAAEPPPYKKRRMQLRQRSVSPTSTITSSIASIPSSSNNNTTTSNNLVDNSRSSSRPSSPQNNRHFYSSSQNQKQSTMSSANSKALPPLWKSAYAEDGAIYYYHRLTGKTQWEFPREDQDIEVDDRERQRSSHAVVKSSIEGVNQSVLEDLVEKTIQASEKKRKEAAAAAAVGMLIQQQQQEEQQQSNSSTPLVGSPLSRENTIDSSSKHNGGSGGMDETELKKEVGKVVTKYLSSKQQSLWKGDKFLFKELARKITHHIVDRETQSSRKIMTMNSNVKSKIEKFIDSHGAELVLKVQRKPSASRQGSLKLHKKL
ncbi:hypothetical protein BDF20DRAFT_840312 [Mycotypha africana]|uniref:uncharacterized protein n=1 Tax=Mycotypha africana TaxID=64632 RepID=UPI002300E2AE|nr:uncharacterized protein BDF20DRAFT_840312 [Mycotypha africana]KAI8967227.1 hypothetical protein BDF20DRAFT_840312 [Mycotypha africana]